MSLVKKRTSFSYNEGCLYNIKRQPYYVFIYIKWFKFYMQPKLNVTV